jgi:hypothetical protein
MKRLLLPALLLTFCLAPCLLAQAEGDHVEVGVFADYFRLSATNPNINFVGVGGRAGFNVHPNVQIEAEMSYDFARNFTSTFSNGITSQFVRTDLRPLHGLFGPKFQTNRGPVRAFVTFKAGFVNFSNTNQNVPAGFTSAVSGVTVSSTRAAIYPGGGLEGFWGPFGLRLDVGDDIYFANGAHNNLKASFGPAFRF